MSARTRPQSGSPAGRDDAPAELADGQAPRSRDLAAYESGRTVTRRVRDLGSRSSRAASSTSSLRTPELRASDSSCPSAPRSTTVASVEVRRLVEQFPARHTPSPSSIRGSDMTGPPRSPGRSLRSTSAMDTAKLPHAFGGALALAWCTLQARAHERHRRQRLRPNGRFASVGALDASRRSDVDLRGSRQGDDRTRRPGPARSGTPPRSTCSSTPPTSTTGRDGEPVDGGLRRRPRPVPVLPRTWRSSRPSFNRTRDWADLEAMVAAGTARRRPRASGSCTRYLGTRRRADRAAPQPLRAAVPTWPSSSTRPGTWPLAGQRAGDAVDAAARARRSAARPPRRGRPRPPGPGSASRVASSIVVDVEARGRRGSVRMSA